MKRLFTAIGWSLMGIVFVPLFLMLLFGMPLEFLISSWHLYRVDARTEGKVIESEVRRHKGGERSALRYSYQVGGTTYTSDRVEAGLVSNRSFQSGGGGFARSAPFGSSMTVYYDSSAPGFSLAAYGWPKWSVGFSMAVWGLLFSHNFPLRSFKFLRGALAYSASRALLLSGALTIALFPVTIGKSEFVGVAVSFGVFLVGAFLCGMLRKIWNERGRG